jgi:formylglycine-generating enzyme required for sulfatase activity
VLDAVTKLFDPKYRNGPVLPPAWRIVEQLGTESDAAQAVREKLLPQDSSDVLKMLNSFKPCPPPDFPQTKYGDHFRPGDKANEWIFKMGAGEDDKEAFFDERPQIEVAIRAFDMAEFPVTNAELEWLDPSHYWLRNQYSRLDDQPALHVNYWTATFYAGWVDQIVRRSKPDAPAANLVIRLPTECEYEFAARGGSPDVYPWGPELENDKCNASSVTLARHESSDRYRNGFKLLHAVGNHFVWCADAYVEDILKKMQSSQPVKAWITRPQPASSVSARGGGLYFNPGDYRVSFRVVIQPTDLRYVTGFRLCRGEAFPASS